MQGVRGLRLLADLVSTVDRRRISQIHHHLPQHLHLLGLEQRDLVTYLDRLQAAGCGAVGAGELLKLGVFDGEILRLPLQRQQRPPSVASVLFSPCPVCWAVCAGTPAGAV